MRRRRGQSILEYTIIIGLVAVVFAYMGTGIKRGVQSLVKVTADQVGNQQNADQDFNDVQQGYMIASSATTQQNKNKLVNEYENTDSGSAVHMVNISVNEYVDSQSNTITNGGFTPNTQ